MPEVLTVIPTYNAARFLPETLECLARQTRRPDRIVVIDNGSTDETESMVRRHPQLRIEFWRNDSNIGVLGNLNRCLGLAAHTDYLHLLMADDLVLPGFLQKTVPVLERASGQALAYVFNEDINQHGAVVGPAVKRPDGPPRQVPKTEFLRRQATLETVLLPGVLFRTQRRSLPCHFRPMPQIADGVFLAECAHAGLTIHEVPEYLCRYRLSDINASSRHRTQLDSFVRDEWRGMEQVSGWIPEPRWWRAVTRAILRFRFAARTEVKRQLFAEALPAYAAEIDSVRLEIAGPILGTLGLCAVRVRDLLRRIQGQPSRVEEIQRLQQHRPSP